MFYAIILACVLLTFIVIVLIKMKNIINELSRVVYSLTKKLKTYDDMLTDTHNEIVTLTTSIDKFILVKSKKIYPTPDISKMVTETVKEQIAIEMILSAGLKLPSAASTDKIIKNTISTYPNIDEIYITKKCLSIIQSAIK